MNKSYQHDDGSVVVVIGSGASGAVVANSLAQRGVDVVCLEAGKRLRLSDIKNDSAEMFGKLSWLDERIGTGSAIPTFPVWTCKTVGGSTVHWTGTSLRMQAHEMSARSSYGHVAGANLVDWPLTAEELAPYYEQAEDRLGVTGTHNIQALPANNNYTVLAASARAVGYTKIDTNNLAINSHARDGRPACIQMGFCSSGCAIGAKWSTLYTEVPQAEASGHFELRSECMAVNIKHQANAKVTAVDYLDKNGQLQTQKARAVCVGGNVVETTRLLLNSDSRLFPSGLANSSGQLGKHYMKHILAAIVGVMPGPVNMHRGVQQGGIVRDEMHHDAARGFVGGLSFLTVPFTPDTLARLMLPGQWGRKLSSVIERYENLACMMIHGEDLPLKANQITLHPRKKDQYGLAVPVVHYEHHENAKTMLAYALKRGHDMYSAIGCEEMYDMVDVLPATHNMGTARMGNDPAQSVTNKWGQTHDIENLFIADGSLFPTAGCENPTLTIVALARRQADYLYTQLEKNSI